MACAFCVTEHHPLESCPASATKYQCHSCKDTGTLNPGWAVNSFLDEPCYCEKYRCRGCFNLLTKDEDPCQLCGTLTVIPGDSGTAAIGYLSLLKEDRPEIQGIEGVLKSFDGEAA